MKAYKCDRCGLLFERKVKNRKHLITITNEYLDLCEHCQDGLDRWMDKFKDNVNEESEKINCKTTKCKNCKNHNYCDYESVENEE